MYLWLLFSLGGTWGSIHGPCGSGQGGRGSERQHVLPGGKGGSGPEHTHLEEEDGVEDQDHWDASIHTLHLWILLTTYAAVLGQIQGQKNEEYLKEDG